MDFDRVTLSQLTGELTEVEADWQDEKGLQVIAALPMVVSHIRDGGDLSVAGVAQLLDEHVSTLDVFRLFLSLSQDRLANRVNDRLGTQLNYSALRRHARTHAPDVARALVELGLADEIRAQLEREWSVEDVLIERYKLMRGRAVAAQKRGRVVEDAVEAVLQSANVPFERGVTFTNRQGDTAKADFAIPTRTDPKIVIEIKAYEGTGSKQSDFLGDVAKIAAAKGAQRYFFIVTDGVGWRNRESGLKQIVAQHEADVIDNIYTRSRLQRLVSDVVYIMRFETGSTTPT